MLPVVKYIDTVDHDDLDVLKFDEKNGGRIYAEFEIGPDDSPGGDNFSASIVNISYLDSRLSEDPYILPLKFIIMKEFSAVLLREIVERICRRCMADSWDEAAHKLLAYFDWEFENYVDSVRIV